MPGEKILVVDDDEEIVDICVEVLEREGYEVKGVTDGLSAIDLGRKNRFDLLITDIMIPGLNGMEVFRAIKKADPGLVGIVITGHGTLYTAVDALKIGFHGFITKPFSDVEICKAVSQCLERSRLEKELIACRRIDKLRDDFLAIVSHELQTPLSLILASTDLLFQMRWGTAKDKERETLRVLKREGRRLSRLTSNILMYSELKFQDVDYHKKPVNLEDITARVVDSMKEEADKKNITINHHLSGSIPAFLGVGRYVRQMMVNFLDNGVKFNQEGGRVTVKTRVEGRHIRCEIDDTGMGVAEEHHRTIFNPFEQLEDTLTRKVGGAGLGLALNKEIIALHGGKVWVESAQRKGSKFIFTIPMD